MIYCRDTGDAVEREGALRRITRPVHPPLCPELRYPGLPRDTGFDGFRTSAAKLIGAAAPYWVLAWPGGQALARYVLDHPEAVAGRHVIDLGCGNGLIAAAAMRAGATSALAVDPDPWALCAAAETAKLNGVEVSTRQADIEEFAASCDAVICAGDLWYERVLARRATTALRRLADAGVTVLCGDPGRPGRPRQRIATLACYAVTASQQFEARTKLEVTVFQLLATAFPERIAHMHPMRAHPRRIAAKLPATASRTRNQIPGVERDQED